MLPYPLRYPPPIEIVPTAVGAGAQLTYTAQPYELLEILSFQFKITCDGTVATRYPKIAIYDTTPQRIWVSSESGSLTSGQSAIFFVQPLQTGATMSGEGIRVINCGPAIWLTPGFIISTNIAALQAGDQVGDSFIYARRWVIPPQ